MKGKGELSAVLGGCLKASLGGALLVGGCADLNQAPVIEQVGPYLIASSVGDFIDPSVVDSPTFEVRVGETLTVELVATDPEEEELTWSAGPIPMGGSFDPKTARFTWTPLHEALYSAGFEMYVVVEDPAGKWDSVIVYLYVAPEDYYARED